MKKHVNKFHLF